MEEDKHTIELPKLNEEELFKRLGNDKGGVK